MRFLIIIFRLLVFSFLKLILISQDHLLFFIKDLSYNYKSFFNCIALCINFDLICIFFFILNFYSFLFLCVFDENFAEKMALQGFQISTLHWGIVFLILQFHFFHFYVIYILLLNYNFNLQVHKHFNIMNYVFLFKMICIDNQVLYQAILDIF